MPNQPVPAAAEGVPSSHPKSLSAAIYRYRADFNAYLSDSFEVGGSNPSAELQARYKSSIRILEMWDRPAESLSDASAALRLALEDYESGDTDRIPAMIKAALGFLDRPTANARTTSPVANSPSLLRVADDLDRVRHLLDLVGLALDGMATHNNQEIAALQTGVMEVTCRLDDACDLLEAHREAAQ